MKIKLTSIYVNDQEKALRFYTDVLGFVKKADFSQGPFRWLTVASAEEPDGTELQLALNNNPAAQTYQQAMFEQSQPAAHVLRGRRPAGARPHETTRRGVHHAADQGDRLDHRDAERHVRQSDPDRRPRPLELGLDATMKKSDASEGQSASELISKRIAELGDWRGETLGRMRKLIKEADPDVVEEWKWMEALRCGRTTASSAPANPTRRS